MNTSSLIISIIGFTLLLFFLVALLIYSSRAKKRKMELLKVPEARVPTFEELKSKLKNKNANYDTLKNTLEDLVELYGEIEPKIGGRQSKDFDRYMELIFIVCKHPNTDKRLVLDFEKDLGRMNPQYKKDLDHAVTKGLSFR